MRQRRTIQLAAPPLDDDDHENRPYYSPKSKLYGVRSRVICYLSSKRNADVPSVIAAMIVIFCLIGIGWILRDDPFYLWETSYPAPPPLPRRTYDQRVQFVREHLQKRTYQGISLQTDTYDIYDCPLEPPEGYPREYPIMDVLRSWNLTDLNLPEYREIFQGLCVFDFNATSPSYLHQQIDNYRSKEVPFVIRYDPHAIETAERWNTDHYLHWKLQQQQWFAVLSKTPSMQYWSRTSHHKVPDDFQPPNRNSHLSFQKWLDMAQHNARAGDTKYKEHAYLRLDGCYNDTTKCDASYRNNGRLGRADFVFDDISVMHPDHVASQHYLVNTTLQRGIQCRFGAAGLVAENHFDNERNLIGMFGGERRYLLGHPRNCNAMELYPQRHPLERHSKVDWNDPNLTEFPNFPKTTINEVVLQAGDLLYLPTYWFHHIVSLNINYQCNTRSGHTVEYDQTIYDCGFFYEFPK